jgi:hypothetical protein
MFCYLIQVMHASTQINIAMVSNDHYYCHAFPFKTLLGSSCLNTPYLLTIFLSVLHSIPFSYSIPFFKFSISVVNTTSWFDSTLVSVGTLSTGASIIKTTGSNAAIGTPQISSRIYGGGNCTNITANCTFGGYGFLPYAFSKGKGAKFHVIVVGYGTLDTSFGVTPFCFNAEYNVSSGSLIAPGGIVPVTPQGVGYVNVMH